MGLGDLLGKVKDLASGAGDIQSLVDKLPENIKSKVEPLIKKFLGGDAGAAQKAVDVLEKFKDNDIAKKLISKLKG
ncbi:MAG: hypothetical protein II135_06170 [Clostridia bacterium]|jgi:hypothetical protein|nr:hypothetical protein [Clostridia bacterium]MBQ3870302.1 hypothetical protein [Clostridia bacterium]